MDSTTPRNFVLQLGSVSALYVSVVALTMLLFSAITLTLPDAGDSVWELEGAAERIRIAIAMLVVFFPTYVVLTRRVNVIRRESHHSYLGLTRWLIYLSLLVGGAVLLGDVVAVVYTFLEGDTTIRFVIKALVLAGIIGTAFIYYVLDARDYWLHNERSSVAYGATVIVVVVAALVWGLYNIEPPAVVRDMKIDNNQIGDLQDMQWRIEDYFRTNASLPPSIDELYISEPPAAPEGRESYSYTVISDTTYELCATFATASDNETGSFVRPLGFETNQNWEHAVGYWCFNRTIDDTYRQ